MQFVPTTKNYSVINSNGFPAFARLKTIHIAHNIIIPLWALARNQLRVLKTNHIAQTTITSPPPLRVKLCEKPAPRPQKQTTSYKPQSQALRPSA